jgi:hypothetical protein
VAAGTSTRRAHQRRRKRAGVGAYMACQEEESGRIRGWHGGRPGRRRAGFGPSHGTLAGRKACCGFGIALRVEEEEGGNASQRIPPSSRPLPAWIWRRAPRTPPAWIWRRAPHTPPALDSGAAPASTYTQPRLEASRPYAPGRARLEDDVAVLLPPWYSSGKPRARCRGCSASSTARQPASSSIQERSEGGLIKHRFIQGLAQW